VRNCSPSDGSKIVPSGIHCIMKKPIKQSSLQSTLISLFEKRNLDEYITGSHLKPNAFLSSSSTSSSSSSSSSFPLSSSSSSSILLYPQTALAFIPQNLAPQSSSNPNSPSNPTGRSSPHMRKDFDGKSSMRILVADDNVINRKVASRLLKMHGHEP